MKAILKLRPEPGAMALGEIDPPPRRPGEVRIAIAAGGICGTDVAIWRWHQAVVGQYAPAFPLVVGHEFAGTIVESDDARLPPGAVVAVNPQIACGRCRYCLMGRPTLCDDRKLMGGRVNGGWTESVCVPAANAHRLPDGIDASVAPLLEPLAVAVHAVTERVPVRGGDVVAIVGAGPIGLLCALVALAAGASKVMVTGIAADAGRLRIAQALGAVPVDIDAQDALAAVRRLQGDGADIVYESSGAPAALEPAIALARKGGQVGLIGLCHGPSTVGSTAVVIRELSLIGSRGYDETTWTRMLAVLPRVAADLPKLVTHELPYAEFERALDLVARREGSKVILRP